MAEHTGTEPVHRRAVARPRSSRQPPRIVVDFDLCKSCGICQQLCPASVFDKDRKGRPAVARTEDCTACRFCEQHCPDFALEVFQTGGERERKGGAGATKSGAGATKDDAGAASRKGGA
jgi:2-oxoglutarate ferredoxin oxidoreductase subunit delta